jgi:tyrosyl-tRNA synthetase
MQAADIFYLNVDIAQLGMDQRKVNMLAREVGPKIGYYKPVAVHHHMLMGLGEPPKDATSGAERGIALKMSKSKPDTAIFMTDSTEDIKRKLKKAYCPEGIVEENPILEYCKYIVFEKFDKLIIERPEKWGGNLEFNSYDELADVFSKKELHPLDLKMAVAKKIDELVNPVREYFEKNKEAKKLLEEVKKIKVTR